MKLNVLSLALAFAIIWAAGVFLFTWLIIFREGPTGEKTLLGRIYLGYKITPAGSIIGAAWAFADGFITAAIFAWIYNLFAA